MPWKVHSLVQARQRFVGTAVRGIHSVALLCRQFHISRKTGFKWLARFRVEGGSGLCNRSRRPKHSPTRTATRWLREIRVRRQRHRRWGAKKIHASLRKSHPRMRLPKVRTIAKWLRQVGLIGSRRAVARRGPALARVPLTIPQRSNHVWTVDFKGWFRTHDGKRVDPLTVRDLFSRYVLDIRLLRHRHEPVQEHFQRLFVEFGQPEIIRVDHGPPFGGDGALDLSRLSAWWLRLGIGVEFTGRARPQDNGAHEQMHRVYKAEVASPSAATPLGQQQRSTRFVHYYNHERPHEALEQQVPAKFYRKSRRRYRGPLPELRYRRGWATRRVAPNGNIRWRGRARVIGRAFGGQRVGFKPIQPGVYEVYFDRHLIGLLVEADPGGMRPARSTKALTT